MTSVGAEQKEKKVVENLAKLVESERLVGCRFKYRPAEDENRIFVKVTALSEGGEGFDVKNSETGEVYAKVQPNQLSIGLKSRSDGDPLISLLRENGLEASLYLKSQGESPEGGLRSERFHTPEEPGLEPFFQQRFVRNSDGQYAGFRGPRYAEAREIRRCWHHARG